MIYCWLDYENKHKAQMFGIWKKKLFGHLSEFFHLTEHSIADIWSQSNYNLKKCIGIKNANPRKCLLIGIEFDSRDNICHINQSLERCTWSALKLLEWYLIDRWFCDWVVIFSVTKIRCTVQDTTIKCGANCWKLI